MTTIGSSAAIENIAGRMMVVSNMAVLGNRAELGSKAALLNMAVCEIGTQAALGSMADWQEDSACNHKSKTA